MNMRNKWPKVKLSFICEDLTKKRLVEVNDQDRIVEPTISSKTNKISTRNETFGAGVKVKKRVKLLPGDLVFARLHTQNGLFAFCTKEYTATQTFVPVKIYEENINKDYLFYALKTHIKNLVLLGDSVGRESYKAEQILSLEIPLPPLPEQKRIVKKIKEIEERINKGILYRMKTFDDFSKLYEESLSKIFRKYNFKTEVFSRVVSFRRGPFGGSLKKEIFVDKGYKVYEQKNAIYNDFSLGHYFITKEKYHDMIAFSVTPGDLIISCSGTIGKIAIVPSSAPKGIINQALLKITPNTNLILPEFVQLILENPDYGDQIFVKVRGSAMKNIGALKNIKKINIPLPTLTEQKRIISQAKNLVTKINGLEKELYENREYFNALMPSILNKAFNGEL